MHPLAQPRGNLGFPDDPSAQRRRGMAPKNIATFNTHTEALEPMAGATLDPLRCLVLRPWVEAMKRRSRAGSKPAKARPPRALKPKGRNAPKAMRHRGSAAAGQDSEVARLTRELTRHWSSRPQRRRCSQVISSSPGDLQPVFADDAGESRPHLRRHVWKYLSLGWRCLHLVATHNTPPAFAEAYSRRRSPLRPIRKCLSVACWRPKRRFTSPILRQSRPH